MEHQNNSPETASVLLILSVVGSIFSGITLDTVQSVATFIVCIFTGAAAIMSFIFNYNNNKKLKKDERTKKSSIRKS